MTDGSFILNILAKMANPLADFLGKYLPRISNNWWEYHVLGYVQSQVVHKVEKNNLHSLDTAVLLKVFDGNWNEISRLEGLNLDYSLRNYIKETQTIRNKWAHLSPTDEINEDIVNRHLDTLYRVSEQIGASSELLEEIGNERARYYDQKYCPKQQPETHAEIKTEDNNPPKQDGIKIGTKVRLISKPEMTGAVTEVFTTGKEPRYTVFVNGKDLTWYHSQIEVIKPTKKDKFVNLDEFNAHITATQLKSSNSSALFCQNSAKIEIIPHQFRPVLKFIKSDKPRLLIADSVGVGKTIEAGLILKELEARNDIESVLIICPKPLVSEQKWEDEMNVKFNEVFTAFDSQSFRQAINDAKRDGWSMTKYGKRILPYSLLTDDKLYKNGRNIGLLELEDPPKYDLVIVDEAHHIRNNDTQAYSAVKYFIENADAALLLTATPIQMGEKDLFTLLNLIRPDIIPDYQTFEQMAAPNPFINAAIAEIRGQRKDWMVRAKEQLIKAAGTAWGMELYPKNPVYNKVIEKLEQDYLDDNERVGLLTDTENLNSFATIINRTRRRDIDSGYASRKSNTVETPFIPKQKEVYDKVMEIQANIFKLVQPGTPAAFMMNTIQRMASSCLPGLIPFLESILKRNLTDDDFIAAGCFDIPSSINIEDIEKDIEELLKTVKELPNVDGKYDNMVRIIKEKQKQNPNKVMIFSTFKHTLRYLKNKLENDGFRVGLIYGEVKDEDRQYLRDMFKLPKEEEDALDILLFSEVGCEGLDYQFCDCMINYDLPWNPMKIEQRIGRIDRTGQKSETVTIFNLITPETVDAEIYNRCLSRIGVFENAIGGSEEILGEIEHDIKNIAENFSLNEEERIKRLNQIADNKIREYHEKEKLNEEQAELFGVSVSSLQLSKEIEDATSFWLSPVSLENMTKIYFRNRLDANGEYIVGSSKSKKLRISSEYRGRLKTDFNNLNPKPEYTRWKRWLDGRDKEKSVYYPVYFNSHIAVDGAGDLITPTHPLIKQAVANISNTGCVCTYLSAVDNDVPEGEYPFSMYLWDYSGIIKNQKLVAISENDAISSNITRYLENGVFSDNDLSIDNDTKEKLESKQYDAWDAERIAYKQKNDENIAFRKQSILQSYNARISAIKHRINTEKDQNIIRMKTDELKKVEITLSDKVDEIERESSHADVETSLVGYGVVKITHE